MDIPKLLIGSANELKNAAREKEIAASRLEKSMTRDPTSLKLMTPNMTKPSDIRQDAAKLKEMAVLKERQAYEVRKKLDDADRKIGVAEKLKRDAELAKKQAENKYWI